MTPPRISVGFPVFNGARYLSQALDSLLNQECSDFELIISDNGSTDETEAICRQRAAADPRIRYERVDVNRGLTWNFERVFALAKGAFFRWAAHDDLCEPTHLRRCLEALESGGGDVCLAYTYSDLIDEQGRLLKPFTSRLNASGPDRTTRFRSVLGNLGLVNPLYGLFRTEVLRHSCRYRPYPSSDFVFMAELALRGRLVEVPEVLFHRRMHEHNSVRSHPSQRELFEFYDPDFKGRRIVLSVNQRLWYETVRMIWTVPMPIAERLICMACAAERFGLRPWRNRFGAWRRGPGGLKRP